MRSPPTLTVPDTLDLALMPFSFLRMMDLKHYNNVRRLCHQRLQNMN